MSNKDAELASLKNQISTITTNYTRRIEELETRFLGPFPRSLAISNQSTLSNLERELLLEIHIGSSNMDAFTNPHNVFYDKTIDELNARVRASAYTSENNRGWHLALFVYDKSDTLLTAHFFAQTNHLKVPFSHTALFQWVLPQTSLVFDECKRYRVVDHVTPRYTCFDAGKVFMKRDTPEVLKHYRTGTMRLLTDFTVLYNRSTMQ